MEYVQNSSLQETSIESLDPQKSLVAERLTVTQKTEILLNSAERVATEVPKEIDRVLHSPEIHQRPDVDPIPFPRTHKKLSPLAEAVISEQAKPPAEKTHFSQQFPKRPIRRSASFFESLISGIGKAFNTVRNKLSLKDLLIGWYKKFKALKEKHPRTTLAVASVTTFAEFVVFLKTTPVTLLKTLGFIFPKLVRA